MILLHSMALLAETGLNQLELHTHTHTHTHCTVRFFWNECAKAGCCISAELAEKRLKRKECYNFK
jgi:hypothetical protein